MPVGSCLSITDAHLILESLVMYIGKLWIKGEVARDDEISRSLAMHVTVGTTCTT